jgi:GH24 family phage-related lysozyme (muramidase)
MSDIPQSVLDRTKSPDFENNIPWMYLDTEGKVTVGAGHMLADADAAAALGFVDDNQTPASDDAKRQAWTTVHGMTAGMPADDYQSATTIRLPQNAIDAVLLSDMEAAEGHLMNAFSGYGNFPEPAKEGLLDMMFNLGPTKFTAANWPNFFAAVNATTPDWNKAANECHREGISENRNDVIKGLFQQAAGGKPGFAGRRY